MNIDLAYRVHSHNYKMDPIIRSLLDIDFYKLLMHQFIHSKYPNTKVQFDLINRSKSVKIGNIIPIEELIEQLDHVRTLKFSTSELIWLKGNSFYGTCEMFSHEYIEYLKSFSMPDYEISIDNENGQYTLTFSGTWEEVTLWEIYTLSIISELRNRKNMSNMSKLHLDILYSNAKTKFWSKITSLVKEELDDLNISDFSTRRRHSFLFQEWSVNAARDILGKSFKGTSNAYLAFKHDMEAIGTNAHELQMVNSVFGDRTDSEYMIQNQYRILLEWADFYPESLHIFLPDTYGTTQFLINAPDWLKTWKGARLDSKHPLVGGEELIHWFNHNDINPTEKMAIFSDGLDVKDIIALHKHFNGRIKVGFGWGTTFSNDFRECNPLGDNSLDPISIVCKVTKANGLPVVKLSDNYLKATGDIKTIEQFRKIYGTRGVSNIPVIV